MSPFFIFGIYFCAPNIISTICAETFERNFSSAYSADTLTHTEIDREHLTQHVDVFCIEHVLIHQSIILFCLTLFGYSLSLSFSCLPLSHSYHLIVFLRLLLIYLYHGNDGTTNNDNIKLISVLFQKYANIMGTNIVGFCVSRPFFFHHLSLCCSRLMFEAKQRESKKRWDWFFSLLLNTQFNKVFVVFFSPFFILLLYLIFFCELQCSLQ